MLSVRVFDQGHFREGDEALLDAKGFIWIELQPPDEAALLHLAKRYGLHKLAIEDCLHLDQRPKLEEYPGHQFLVLQGFSCAGQSLAGITLHELHVFLGPDWMITVHEKAHSAIEAVCQRMRSDPAGTLGRGVDFVAYLLADALVDSNFPMLEKFNDTLEALEDRIFETFPTAPVMQEALSLKRQLIAIRRVLSPQRDVVGLLARRGIPQVQEHTTLYFRDVYDHLIRIFEQLESARDLIGDTVEAYLSVLANRTSDISKQLTIFATLFLPLSFVVGFFGQNFEILSRPIFFWTMLALMVALPTALIYWFRHKEWL